MEYATQAYLTEIKQNIRGKSYVRVYLGVINQKAQGNAFISSSFTGTEEGLYDDKRSAGVTSTEADGHIQFEFHDLSTVDLRGLTLTFGDTVPTDIIVENGNKTLNYTVHLDDDGKFTAEDYLNDSEYIRITPNAGKLNLKKITFGVGLVFGNTDLISTSRSNTIKHLNDELPVKRFSFTVHNYKGLWNKDNPASNARYLQEKQEVRWDYQRELPDGSLYTVPGGQVLLNTWSSNDQEAKFTCVGNLDYIDSTYYKGKFYPNGITLYELAQTVLMDAGIENYHLDPQLSKTKVYNPLPITTHKACLQMIANAARSILYEDRDGYISIRPADRPAMMADADFLYGTCFSDGGAIVNPSTNDNYASFEPGYLKLNRGMSFPPEDETVGPYLPVGFVSEEYADSNGGFANNPQINIKMQSAYKLSQLVLNCIVPPKNIMLRMTLEDEEVYKIFTDNIEDVPVFSFEPILCDRIEIIFASTTPGQRIHVNNVDIKGDIVYTITYRDLYQDTPVASSLDKVATLNIHMYDYTLGTSTNTVSGEVIQGRNLFTMSNPSGAYSATYKDGIHAGASIPVAESGAYYVVLDARYPGNVEIQYKEYIKTDKTLSTTLMEEGGEVESKNPLISTLAQAQACEDWMEKHYMNDVEYDLTFRGDPIIDADDVVYLENRFVNDNLIRIESENLSTSQGMEQSNRIIARRISYSVVPVVGTAVVGYFRAE